MRIWRSRRSPLDRTDCCTREYEGVRGKVDEMREVEGGQAKSVACIDCGKACHSLA